MSVFAYIGLGANLGDAQHALMAAADALRALPHTEVTRLSPFYRSAPIDSSGPDYVNAVALIHTDLPALSLLAALLGIEAEHGRQRPYRNAPRTLDMDLLIYGDEVIDTPTLTVPHPRMHQRAFVLRPLADLAPSLVVPGHGAVQALLPSVADQALEALA